MRWRIRAIVRSQLAPGDEIRAIARDEIGRDYWVLTDHELLQVKGGVVAQRMALADAVVSVTMQPPAGITFRLSSRRAGNTQMLTSFRRPNAVTRRLAELFGEPS